MANLSANAITGGFESIRRAPPAGSPQGQTVAGGPGMVYGNNLVVVRTPQGQIYPKGTS